MQSPQDDFMQLVRQAPAAGAGLVVALGNLSRAEDDDHFVLTLSNGIAETLPVAIEKRHREMLGAFGQQLVEVKLDPSGVSAEAANALGIAQSAAALAAMPFVLGGGHQVDPRTLEAMQAAEPPGMAAKRPVSDFKRPSEDGTYPTPHGLHLDY